MTTVRESPWQQLLRMSRPIVGSPQSGAERVVAFNRLTNTAKVVEVSPDFSDAVQAIVQLKADDLPMLFRTVKSGVEKSDSPGARWGYQAVLATMADHVAALERRGELTPKLHALRGELTDTYARAMNSGASAPSATSSPASGSGQLRQASG